MSFRPGERPQMGVMVKPLPLRCLPLSDASLAALHGVSEEDWHCHQLVVWGRLNPDAYRVLWRQLLVQRGYSAHVCDRFLQAVVNSNYAQMMTFFLFKRGAKYHADLKPQAVKALLRALDVKVARLLPHDFRLVPAAVPRRAETCLAERLACYANRDDQWVKLVRQRTAQRYGRTRNGKVAMGTLALDIYTGLRFSWITAQRMLRESQEPSKDWTVAKVKVVCALLDWPLAEAAEVLNPELVDSGHDGYRWAALPPLVVGEVPDMSRFMPRRRLRLRPLGVEERSAHA